MTAPTYWNTKYALSAGIIKEEGCELDQTTEPPSTYVTRGSFHLGNPGGYLFLRLGHDIFATEEEALTDAQQKAERKLRSLDKERVKIKALATKWKDRKTEQNHATREFDPQWYLLIANIAALLRNLRDAGELNADMACEISTLPWKWTAEYKKYCCKAEQNP